jgi:hypothetical protein
MTNRLTGKYLPIIALQNNTTNNSLWRSISALTLRTNNIIAETVKGNGQHLHQFSIKTNGNNGNFLAAMAEKVSPIQKTGLSLRIAIQPLRALLS